MHHTAVITGATSGIGLATARRFAQANYDLAICARNVERLENIRQSLADEYGVQVAARACDLSSSVGVTGFAQWAGEQFDHIGALVNNAADAPVATTAKITNELFERLIALNIRAPFFIAKGLLSRLAGGAIVNISSQSAVDPFMGLGVYGASKAWIDLWTKSLAAEVAGDNIGVFSVRPGAVATPLLTQVAPNFPADRALQPEEVAEVIFALATPPWRVASGEAINVQCKSRS